jgi:hypothetical protein
MTDENTQTNIYPDYKMSINLPKYSNWTCYLFGSTSGYGLTYTPQEGRVPNRFVRFMMRICFDCKWVKKDK